MNPLLNRLEITESNFNLALNFYKNKNYEKAITHLTTALNNNLKNNPKIPNNKILYYLFLSYQKNKQYKKSLTILKKIIGISKTKRYNHFEQGLGELNNYFSTNNKENIKSALKHFVKGSPNDPDNQYYLGYCYLLLNKKNDAKLHFKACLTLDPKHLNIHSIELFNSLTSQ